MACNALYHAPSTLASLQNPSPSVGGPSHIPGPIPSDLGIRTPSNSPPTSPPPVLPIPAKSSVRLVRNSDHTRLCPPRSRPVSRCIIRMGRNPCVDVLGDRLSRHGYGEFDSWQRCATPGGMGSAASSCYPSATGRNPSATGRNPSAASRTTPMPVHGAHIYQRTYVPLDLSVIGKNSATNSSIES